MLRHLRQRIIQALQQSTTVALATSGPAGLEIGPCEVRLEGLRLFLLISATSEHLVNIERCPQVAITQDHWRLTGLAKTPCSQKLYLEGERFRPVVLEVRPSRFEFLAPDTNQAVETFDIAEGDWAS